MFKPSFVYNMNAFILPKSKHSNGMNTFRATKSSSSDMDIMPNQMLHNNHKKWHKFFFFASPRHVKPLIWMMLTKSNVFSNYLNVDNIAVLVDFQVRRKWNDTVRFVCTREHVAGAAAITFWVCHIEQLFLLDKNWERGKVLLWYKKILRIIECSAKQLPIDELCMRNIAHENVAQSSANTQI